jgi:drug/metabolite transporter (DMT)-like permease
MASLLIGLAFAFAAAALYAAGIALQALEAREAPEEHALRVSLFRRLVARPRWLAGTAVGLAGWALQALALTRAPLTLVQPAVAMSLVFLLAIGARVLGERVGREEVAAVVALAGSVAVLGWAAPGRESAHATGPRLWITLGVLGAVALVPYAFRGAARSASILVPVSAGLAYSWDGLATKFASDDYARSAWLGLGMWFVAMMTASGVGTLSEMSALRRRPVTQVAPIVFALNTFVPVALAPLLAHEAWPSESGRLAALVVALVVLAVGVVSLARSTSVDRVLAEGRSSESETGRRSRASSAAITRITEARASGGR